MKKAILTTLFGAFFTILYLVLAIQSFSVYDDGYGTDVSVNADYITLLVAGIIVLVTGIKHLVRAKKNQELGLLYPYGYQILGFLMTFYPLGLGFKMIWKNKPCANYFVWAIFGAFILAYGVISYLDNKKKEQ